MEHRLHVVVLFQFVQERFNFLDLGFRQFFGLSGKILEFRAQDFNSFLVEELQHLAVVVE